ncbi:TPA: PIN domain-containing protein [Candidatus Micrarchaeota archaeon]|nr:PIN domain-containing protein [Candidatus Micrarchaeota archaeon]
MAYADTDFFIALFKPNDWLKQSAIAINNRYKNELWTSGATVVEIFLICKEYNLDPLDITVALFNIAEVRDMDRQTAIAAAHFMKDHGLSPLDSFHAAFCGNDKIISSDSVFDKLGFERIRIGK